MKWKLDDKARRGVQDF